ncbi:hypothetical protein BH09BAC1_BH09BAC1_20660 [soil metagenome]
MDKHKVCHFKKMLLTQCVPITLTQSIIFGLMLANRPPFLSLILFMLAWMGILSFSACTPDDTAEEIYDLPIGNSAVMIINEGNYTFGNASISYYNPLNGNLYEDIFLSQNSRPLGDVAHSMISVNGYGYGYISVNNSNKIEVVNLVDFTSVATITGLTSPRYILPLGDGRAYVSDLYAEKLTIINLNTNTAVGVVNLPGWTEQMVLANGLVFVANYDSQRVEIINPLTDSKINHIDVDGHPLEMVKDFQGQIWVLGQKEGSEGAALTRIDPNLPRKELTLSFPPNEAPTDMIADPAGDFLYFINSDGIYKMATSANALPAQPMIPKGGRNYYAIGLTPDNGYLYAADALDFNQRSDVYLFNLTTGVQNATVLKTGIISGSFYFYPR